MEFIAHRGCADHNPGNSLRAVEAAAERLPAVEVDVRRCGSGELVCFHDESVDERTDGTGRVAELDWGALRRLRLQGSTERIPRFAELVDAVPESTTIQIELKEPGLSGDVRAILDDQNRSDFRISSFSPPALAEIEQSDWQPETGLLFGADPAANLALAKSLGCQNLHPHQDLCLHSDIIGQAHDAGIRVIAWGLSITANASPLADHGVDGVTIDTWNLSEEANNS